MQYRQLGSTGLSLSNFGFGCGPSSGLIVYGSREERRQAVARALDLGINHFDTAPGYGGTLSEEHLGETLRDLGVRPLVGTKLDMTAQDLLDIPAATRRSVEASLGRLGLDTIDIYYLHGSVLAQPAPRDSTAAMPGTSVEQVLGPGGVAETLELLRAEGKIRYLGFSATGDDPGPNTRIIESGRFNCAQIWYSILNPTTAIPPPPGFKGPDRGQIIPKAAARGMGVVVIRPLELGALSGRDERHPQDILARGTRTEVEMESKQQRSRALESLAAEHKQSRAQVALRYVLSTAGVSTVLVGFTTIRQIEEATAASDAGSLRSQDLERIAGLYGTDFGLGAAQS